MKSPATLKFVFYILGYFFMLCFPFICTFIASFALMALMLAISAVTIHGFDWILLATKVFCQDRKVNMKLSEINVIFGNLVCYFFLPILGIPCAYALILLLTVIYYVLLAKNNTILWRKWWYGKTVKQMPVEKKEEGD
jgi:hypothetical protein